MSLKIRCSVRFVCVFRFICKCWIRSGEIEMPRSLNACTFSLQNKLSRCCFCNQRIKDRVRYAGGPCHLILFE